jgi:hypothetical protein
MERAR